MENQAQQKLPNSTGTLVLGICSIVASCCYGIVGLICGIVALMISKEANKLLKENPDGYSDAGNHKAGRVCAIIGVSLSALYIILILVYIAILGIAFADLPSYNNY
jgi:hypothetical protein